MNILSAYITNAGRDGRENEDAVLEPITGRNTLWTAVADGVGGHEGGALASSEAIMTVRECVMNDDEISIGDLYVAVKKRLSEVSSENPALEKMSTTLSVIKIAGSHAVVGHVGDSRVYHLRGEGLVNRTKDQTEVQRLLDEGVLNEAQAKKYYRRNVLLSVLSARSDYQLDVADFDIEEGDRILLISDGVYKVVLRREIRNFSKVSSSPSELVAAIDNCIRERGPVDDYSVVCLQVVK